MRLYVMRHGPAEDRAFTERDFDRVLTRAGREIVARAAEALRRARETDPPSPPLRLLSSPLLRARETADLLRAGVAAVSGAPPSIEIREELGADADVPHALVREIADAGADAVLVGHQPTIEELVRALVHPARFALPGGFRTATIVTLELMDDGERWRLTAVVDPHASAT